MGVAANATPIFFAPFYLYIGVGSETSGEMGVEYVDGN